MRKLLNYTWLFKLGRVDRMEMNLPGCILLRLVGAMNPFPCGYSCYFPREITELHHLMQRLKQKVVYLFRTFPWNLAVRW